jgi:integrase
VAQHEPAWLEYFQFLHDTGCRVGEVAALTWANVDLDRKRARIEASYSPVDGKDKSPKTHQRRYIDLSDLVVTQLLAWRPRQKRDALKDRRKPPAYVFTNTHGSPRRQDGNMRRVFARVVKACKLGDHTPHDFRDTFATLHLTDDYSRLPWVSRQLGHETERTTIDHYYGFLPTKASEQFANQIR